MPGKNKNIASEISEFAEAQEANDPIAELQQRIAELEAQLAAKEAPPPAVEAGKTITFANGARYEMVGKCAKCGMDVYNQVTKLGYPEGIGDRVVTYVPNARPPNVKGEELPPATSTLYCRVHDPFFALRSQTGRPRNPGDVILAKDWQPLGQGRSDIP